MRFGYGFITCQRHPDEERSDYELYREALELAQEAETLGFDSVWTSEHHFQDDAYMPSVLPMSAAIAARTKRIDVGIGVLLAPFYHPLRLAEDAATIDLISGGRFILGLGIAWLAWEFEALGVPFRQRVRRTEEAIRICREAWSEGRVEPAGLAVSPSPARPGGPPIWIGAEVEPAVRRAGRLADGFMSVDLEPTEFARQVGWAREEADKRDHPNFEMSGYWPVFTWEEGNAWEMARPYVHYMAWKYEDSERAKGRLGPPPRPPQLDAETEATLRATCVCGTPEQVVEQIQALRAAAGERFTFVGRFYYPGMDRDTMRRATRLFAERVMPAFR